MQQLNHTHCGDVPSSTMIQEPLTRWKLMTVKIGSRAPLALAIWRKEGRTERRTLDVVGRRVPQIVGEKSENRTSCATGLYGAVPFQSLLEAAGVFTLHDADTLQIYE